MKQLCFMIQTTGKGSVVALDDTNLLSKPLMIQQRVSVSLATALQLNR
jgi:hypothetical protein